MVIHGYTKNNTVILLLELLEQPLPQICQDTNIEERPHVLNKQTFAPSIFKQYFAYT